MNRDVLTILNNLLVFKNPLLSFLMILPVLDWKHVFTTNLSQMQIALVAWIWNFGDGSSSSLQNPCYTYTTPGEYEVALQLSIQVIVLQNLLLETISVDYPPEADFYASPVCFHDSTQFVNLTDTHDIEIAYWEWDFDDPGSGVNNTIKFI